MALQAHADLNNIISQNQESDSQSFQGLGSMTSCTSWLYDYRFPLFNGMTLLASCGRENRTKSTSVNLQGQNLLHVSFVFKGAKLQQHTASFAKLNSIYCHNLAKNAPEQFYLAAGKHFGFSLLVNQTGIENLIKLNGLSLNTGAALLKLLGTDTTCPQEHYTSIESKSLAHDLFDTLQRSQPNQLALNATLFALSESVLNDIAKGVHAKKSATVQTALDILSCKELIDNAKDLSLSTANLAHMYQVSEATLNRHFKNIYGETITSYLKRVKFDFAKAQLMEYDASLSTLASQTGYSDMASFSRAFKKHFGIPPSMVNSNKD